MSISGTADSKAIASMQSQIKALQSENNAHAIAALQSETKNLKAYAEATRGWIDKNKPEIQSFMVKVDNRFKDAETKIKDLESKSKAQEKTISGLQKEVSALKKKK